MFGVTTDIQKEAKCTAAVAEAYTIAKFGADDDTVDLATAATDSLVGIMQHTTDNAGDDVRVALEGISLLKLGGVVTRGDFVTSDANGKGVSCAPAQGANSRYIGEAMASGVAGDLVPVKICCGIMQGA